MIAMIFFIAIIDYKDSIDKKTLTIEGNEDVTQSGVQKNGFSSEYETINIISGITGIQNNAFRDCTSIMKVIIPSTVKYAGSLSFGRCLKLKEIIFPVGLIRIAQQCFYSCSEMTTATFPYTLQYIEYNIFRQCHKLESIKLDSKNEYFDLVNNHVIISKNKTVVACTSNTTLHIPTDAKTISVYMCYKMRISVVIFDGDVLERIEKGAFEESSLNSIVLPPNIKHLESNIFNGCPLKSIKIPRSLLSASDNVFTGSSLTDITVEDGCMGMWKDDVSGAIYNSSKTTIIFFPSNLSNITIPPKIEIIGDMVLQSASNLKTFAVDDQNQNLSSYENILYSKYKSTLIACPGAVEKAIIHKNCTQISGSAFWGTIIKNVTFEGDEVTTIGRSAFEDCTKLQYFQFPKMLKTISVNAFAYTGFDNQIICFPEEITKIEEGAFTQTNLKGADFSKCKNIVKFDRFAFSYNKKMEYLVLPKTNKISEACFVLTNISSVIIPENVSVIDIKAFSNIPNLKNVTFKSTVLREINQWAFAYSGLEVFTLPDSVQVLGSYSFSGCKSLFLFEINKESLLTNINTYIFFDSPLLKEIFIGDNVESIKPRAFSGAAGLLRINVSNDNKNYSSKDGLLLSKLGCTLISCPGGLESVFVKKSVLEIWDSGFFNCSKLINIIFEESTITGNLEGLQTIGPSTFEECISLKTIFIPGSVLNISRDGFSGCKNLKNVTFAENSKLLELGSGAFAGCTDIENIIFKFGSNLEIIGEGCFKGCKKLLNFKFPDRINYLGSRSFEDCISLKSVILPEGLNHIGDNCFSGCIGCELFILPSSLKEINQSALASISTQTIVKYCGNNNFSGVDILGDRKIVVQVKVSYQSDLFGRSKVFRSLDAQCNSPTSKFTFASSPDALINLLITNAVSSDDD